ncbi:MAG: VWA domain-containing protein [Acidobacteria bacterium]|jgi:VWFA-related protein|nr:VWA domain-containing protein [Acidobacteriota bacterium]MCU0254732.1 VWA domain-containing protein [Acidobacteriota bacterium]
MPRTHRFVAAVLLAAAPFSLVPALAAGEARVVILKPAKGALLLGPTEVEFRLDGIDPATVAEATILLDRRPLARLAEPPWRATIEAGEEITRHQLDVVVRLSGGREIKASQVYEAGAGVQEIDVRLINVSFTAVDRKGRLVPDLNAAEVAVRDQGKPVRFERFRRAGPPLDVALVFDTSNSMQGDRLADAQRAALAFLDALPPQDHVVVLDFGEDVRVSAPLSGDREAARTAVAAFGAAGGTALYDAVYEAAKALAAGRSDARRVMVVLSDGRDEASSGLEPGSFHTLEEAIRQAHLKDAALFTLGIGSALKRDTDFTGRMTTEEVLSRLAGSTGGRYLPVERSRNLADAYRDVLEELRQRYDLAFTPAPRKPGESWRTLEVTTTRPGVTIRAREGYYVR